MSFANKITIFLAFVTAKETFIHPSNVQDQTRSKEGTCLK